MQLIHLTLAILLAIEPAHSLKRKTWHGPPNRLNSTDLIFCLDRLAADLVAADVYNNEGWSCANSHFQIGGSVLIRLPASRTRRECHDESLRAAKRGEAWFKCKCQKGLSHSWLTWSPLGWKSCKNKNGAPCKMEDGWWPKEGDDGAACRADGYCPITTEFYLQTVQTTVTVEETKDDATYASQTGDAVPTTQMAKDETLSSLITTTPSTSRDIETVTGPSTTETLSWETPLDLPIVIGRTPSPSSTNKPLAQPDSNASETVIIVTMTSGQTPTTTSTSPTPTTPYKSITSTIINGKTYTFLKESPALTSAAQPITAIVGGKVQTVFPASATSSAGRR